MIEASLASLLLSSWLHIAWDLFTNQGRALPVFSGLLGFPLVHFGAIQVTLCRGLWLGTSAGVVALLIGAYVLMLKRAKAPPRLCARGEMLRCAAWFGLLLAPFLGTIPLALRDSDPGTFNTLHGILKYFN